MTQLRHSIPDELNRKILQFKIGLQKANPSKDITFTDALIRVIERGLRE